MVVIQLSLWSRDARKIDNLRTFMEVAYRYWQHRGWWRAAQVKIIDVMNGVALFFAVFLLAYYVNWDLVLTCKSDECIQSFPVDERSIFLEHGSFSRTPGSARWIAVVFLCANAVVVIFEVFKCVREIIMQREMHDFAKQFLKPSSETTLIERVLGGIQRGGSEVSRRVMSERDGYVELGRDNNVNSRDAPPHYEEGDVQEEDGDNEAEALIADIADWSGFGGREEVVLEEDMGEEGPAAKTTPNGRSLPTESLEEVSWSSFLQRLCWVLQNDRDAVRDSPETFDELRAVQILMLHANFFIALHQPRVVGGDTFPTHQQTTSSKKVTYLRSVVASGSLKLLDDNLLEHIIATQFDEYDSTLQRSEEEKVAATRSQIRILMFMSFLLYPFIVSVFLTRLLVKNIGDVRTRGMQEMVAVRTWTDAAKWTFRLYNEVPHVSEARLRKGLKSANAIVDGAHVPFPVTKSVQRIASTVVLVILLIAFLNPTMLTLGAVWDLNLFWWLSTAVVVYSAFDAEPTDREYAHESDLIALTEALHYEEPSWRRSAPRCAATLTSRYLRRRGVVVIQNLLRVVFTPAVLMHLYFDEADVRGLVRFVHNNSETIEGVGTCFKAAAFNERWGSYSGGDMDGGGGSHVEGIMRHIIGRGAAAASGGEGLFGDDRAVTAVVTQEHLKNLLSLVSFTAVYRPWAAAQEEGDGPLGDATRAVSLITSKGLAVAERSVGGRGFEEYSPLSPGRSTSKAATPVDSATPIVPSTPNAAVSSSSPSSATHLHQRPFVLPLNTRGPAYPSSTDVTTVHDEEQGRMRAFSIGLGSSTHSPRGNRK